MEARDLSEADLVPILGTQAAVIEVLNHKRQIQREEARKLADFFHVDVIPAPKNLATHQHSRKDAINRVFTKIYSEYLEIWYKLT